MSNIITLLITGLRWQDIIEIVLLALIIYRFLVFIKATRAIQVLKGLGLIVFFVLLSHLAELHIINLLMRSLIGISAIALIIVFQPELRRFLAQLGKKPGALASIPEEQMIENIVKAVSFLADKRRGALIVIEGDTGLEEIIETGIPMESKITSELIDAIFSPQGALHDGAVIIREGKMAAASCVIPLSEAKSAKPGGLRHLAAFSLSSETDAAAIVVSEETGEISLAHKGAFKHNLDSISLGNILRNIYGRNLKRWQAVKK